ncbi:TPA: glycosyltransferase family 2 protein [Candidatus Woesearchaeota archaeon]|nr:glycosyltransferase family 2 protein [Candidatus Woesearchaeota archaeon]HIH54901.1 glycosyltransferase family 2 protein [Candidatus Woesearchaeota archaeon]HIJ14626.1 glycosyltransferase family 2 protein [Candidatus Woesearchaeota archaeon]
MNKPKVTVAIGIYNTEKYLGESIQSVLDQSMKDFELILVDDCSTDNSFKIMKRYAAKDKRIEILRNKKNLYIGYSRNRTFKIAKGEYIAIHDSDDICTKDRLKKQADYLDNHPDIFMVAGSYEYIDMSGKYIGKEVFDYDYKKVASRLVVHNMIHNPTVMFRNDKQTYHRTKMIYAGDRDLWMRLLTSNKRIVVLPDIVSKYRVHPSSVSMSKHKKQKLFTEKAIEFYYERRKFGKDSYDKFDPDKILLLKENNIYNDILIEKRRIQLLLLTDKKQYRKELINFWKRSGLRKWKRLPLTYILSFIPQKISNIFTELFSDNFKKFKLWYKYYFLKKRLP